MKIKVTRAFIDAETATGYNEGDIYTETDSDRTAELRAGGYLADTPKKKKTAKTDTDSETGKDQGNDTDSK